MLGCPTGKRLAPVLPDLVRRLRRFDELAISDQTAAQLVAISAATIDRRLAPARAGMALKGGSHTKPGSLLKDAIAIRTWAQWDDAVPGFVEIDLGETSETTSERRNAYSASMAQQHLLGPLGKTFTITCGACGLSVAANIVQADERERVFWLRCPSCGDGSVRTLTGAVYPTSPAGSAVGGLPPDVDAAWREVRTAQAVAAYTAAEIMCRKILMHLAVDLASGKPGESFTQYIDDLERAGYVTPGLKPVIDKVRSRGNIANHDLPASSEPDSLATLRITEHLLRTAYEAPSF